MISIQRGWKIKKTDKTGISYTESMDYKKANVYLQQYEGKAREGDNYELVYDRQFDVEKVIAQSTFFGFLETIMNEKGEDISDPAVVKKRARIEAKKLLDEKNVEVVRDAYLKSYFTLMADYTGEANAYEKWLQENRIEACVEEELV